MFCTAKIEIIGDQFVKNKNKNKNKNNINVKNKK